MKKNVRLSAVASMKTGVTLSAVASADRFVDEHCRKLKKRILKKKNWNSEIQFQYVLLENDEFQSHFDEAKVSHAIEDAASCPSLLYAIAPN